MPHGGAKALPERIGGIPIDIPLKIDTASASQIGTKQGVVEGIRLRSVGVISPAKEAKDGGKAVDIVVIWDQFVCVDHVEAPAASQGLHHGKAVRGGGFIDQYLREGSLFPASAPHSRIAEEQVGVHVLQLGIDDPAVIQGVAEEEVLGVGEVCPGQRCAAGHPVARQVFHKEVVVGAKPAPAGGLPAHLVPARSRGGDHVHRFLCQGVFCQAFSRVGGIQHAVVAGSGKDDQAVRIGQAIKSGLVYHGVSGHLAGVRDLIAVGVFPPILANGRGVGAVRAPVQQAEAVVAELALEAVIAQRMVGRIGGHYALPFV